MHLSVTDHFKINTILVFFLIAKFLQKLVANKGLLLQAAENWRVAIQESKMGQHGGQVWVAS